MNDHTLIGIIITLLLGSYGFTYIYSNRGIDMIIKRLNEIEKKIDDLINKIL